VRLDLRLKNPVVGKTDLRVGEHVTATRDPEHDLRVENHGERRHQPDERGAWQPAGWSGREGRRESFTTRDPHLVRHQAVDQRIESRARRDRGAFVESSIRPA